jgi:dTDP-glucose pyrophosphorylase
MPSILTIEKPTATVGVASLLGPSRDEASAGDSPPDKMKTILIHEAESVKEALKKLDKTAEKVLIVVDDDMRLLGTISDGDIRRHLLKGRDLEEPILDVYHRQPITMEQHRMSMAEARETMLKHKIELLPVIDAERRVIDFLSWSQAFTEKKPARSRVLDLPVVIMAGGKGTRLEPFTKVFPKPLIPLGDKPIIEVIIDEFRHYGINRFFITLNYKADMIEAYFKSVERDYEITFVREEEFLGTAGSLRLLQGRIDGTFILSNCDTVVKANYEEVVRLHREQESFVTILSALRHYEIPYGVLTYGAGGEIQELVEKPECTFTINTGCYVLDSRCLEHVPEGYYDMPTLIGALIAQNRKAITYPVNESDYVDIGQWEEYRRTLKHFELGT